MWKYFMIALLAYPTKSFSQKVPRIFITSSAGLLIPQNDFSRSYKKSFALNSGIEYVMKKGYYAQMKLDFNTVKYDQQVLDINSSFLFQNTNSSVILIGPNFGKNIIVEKTKTLSLAPYVGFGYANIGEPRLKLDTQSGIISQSVRRMQGMFARAGLRIMVKANSKLTLMLDPSYWVSNIHAQDSTPMAISLFVGTKVPF